MQVTFYNFTKRKNSTARPGEGASLNCQLKQDTSISNPVFIINGWNAAYNYAYVPTWGRYYFVTDATYLTGQRVEAACSVDVLATYKSNIQGYTGFVERSFSQFNVFVEDNLVTNTLDIVNEQSITTTLPSPFDSTAGCYVLRVVNRNGSTQGVASYVLTKSQLSDVLSFMFNDGNFSDILSDATVKSFFNPFQYIVSLMWFPFKSDAMSGDDQLVTFGWWESSTRGKLVNNTGGTGVDVTVKFPENKYADFRKYSPLFSQYSMTLPGMGTIDINGSDVGNGLNIILDVDSITGIGRYRIITTGEAQGGNATIATYDCQIGVPIQIGQMSQSITKTGGSILSTIGSIFTGNIAGAVSGAVNSIQSATNPTPSVNGYTGTRFNYVVMPRILTTLINFGTCDRPETVAGRPLYKNIRLGNLYGYIKCGAASVPIPGYDAEKDAVNNYLNSGFYLE